MWEDYNFAVGGICLVAGTVIMVLGFIAPKPDVLLVVGAIYHCAGFMMWKE